MKPAAPQLSLASDEQTAFKLFHRHSLPGGVLGQRKQGHRRLDKHVRLAQVISSRHAHCRPRCVA